MILFTISLYSKDYTQVKIFEDTNIVTLQVDVNRFLKTFEYQVLDVKLVVNPNGHQCYIMIVYKIKGD